MEENTDQMIPGETESTAIQICGRMQAFPAGWERVHYGDHSVERLSSTLNFLSKQTDRVE